MYIKTTQIKKNNETKKYAKIIEGYFDKEKNDVRQKVIFNYGRIKDDTNLLKCQEILQEYKQGDLYVNLNEFNIDSSKSYGIYYRELRKTYA